MKFAVELLPKEEQVMLALRGVFAQSGYARYQMSSFESYDMYLANKSFLKSGGIITFTDAHGRLKALKPDVTMSIVKNTKETVTESKLYYIESVFRTAAHGSEIREISQMGIEYIGGEGTYAEAEVVRLATQSLAAISGAYVLDISHMGFVTALLDRLHPAEETRAAMLAALRSKNAHTLRALALQSGCTVAQGETLAALATLAGPVAEILPKAAAMACCDEMHAAVTALQSLYDTLCAIGIQQKLRLDFSITSDVDYYNGLMLQGYVQGVPHAVLAGGRYDNLMRRFGKPQAALGFAVYLGELGRAFAEKTEYDVDVLLLYTAQQQPALVAKAVAALQAQGKSVRAAQSAPPALRAAKILRMNDDGEVAAC